MELEEARDILANCIDDYVISSYCNNTCDEEVDCKNEDCIFHQAIEVVLNHLTKQEKMIDELKNGVHYQECINCGKEIRVKRTDAKYCNECAKLKQKEYFKNMPDEKKKERAEKSKQYMRELRAKRKVEESE